MTRRHLFGFSFFAFAALVACTGGSPTLPLSGPLDPARTAPLSRQSWYVQIPPIVPASPLPMPPLTTPYVTPPPALLSSATRSVRIFEGSKPLGVFSLSPSTHDCYDGQFGLECQIKVSFSTTVQVKVRAITYATKDGTGAPLAQGNGLAESSIVSLDWAGIARRLAIRALPSTLHVGMPSWSTLFVYGVDAAGAVIPEGTIATRGGTSIKSIALRGTGPYAFSQTLASSFSTTAFAYDGHKAGTETIAATPGGGLAPASAAISLSGAPSPTPLLFANVALGYGTGLAEFAQGTSGNVSPLAIPALPAAAATVFGADPWNDVWISYPSSNSSIVVERFDSSLHPLTQLALPCGVSTAADAQARIYTLAYDNENDQCEGYVRRKQTLNQTLNVYVLGPKGWKVQWGLDVTASSGALAVDSKGNVYVCRQVSSAYPYGYGISEYAAGAAGAAPPIQNLDTGGESASQLAVDEAGDVFALFPNSGVWEFPAGSATAVPRVTGVGVLSFAVAPSGTIYASVTTDGNAYAVEAFGSSAQSPTSILAGPQTQLFIPTQYYPQPGEAQIAVAQ